MSRTDTCRTLPPLPAFLLCTTTPLLLPPAVSAQEIGPNDFRISFVGGTGSALRDAEEPAVAYNPDLDEYLVVFEADNNTGLDNDVEIWGQRLAADGETIGSHFQISETGLPIVPDWNAHHPDVAYNTTDHEYLVVWHADDIDFGLWVDELEVFGRRLAADGTPVGPDFRISDMGGTGNLDYFATHPAVAYDSTDNEYLVVWRGGDNVGGLIPGEWEIFGQRLDAATGMEVGSNDFRISDMGGTGDSFYDAYRPALAYNVADNEYLVVWHGNDNVGGLILLEYEIFGQRLNAATGTEVGSNDFRISDMGGTGDSFYDASHPALAYNVADNEYLVVWRGDDDVNGLVDEEKEIFGQRLDAATGTELGENDFRISSMGYDGVISYLAHSPDVAYSVEDNEYLVVWYGDDYVGDLTDGEDEIFAQYVDGSGTIQSPNDLRLSDMGGTGDNPFDARLPAAAAGASGKEFLVVWQGDDDVDGLVDEEYEIFGQRVVGGLDVIPEELSCQAFTSADLPKPIPEGAGTSGLTVSTLEVGAADGGIIHDLDVFDLFGRHALVLDLAIFLESPAGDLIQLRQRQCSGSNFDLQFDDQAPPGEPPCPPSDGDPYQPFQGLATFFGEDSTGIWTLVILDAEDGNVGQLDSWALEICTTFEDPIFADGFESGDPSAWSLVQ